jgi:4-hydroxybenzoate polyprenyltransferase
MGGTRTHVDELRATLSGLLYEIRPWQWYKQGILLVGIVFARRLFDPTAWQQVLLGLVAFCAVAGAVYVFNDISDVEEDRQHPEKRNRPIASGQVSIPTATVFAGALLAGGLVLSYTVGVLFLVVVGAYVLQNAIYSASLKDVVHVDVMIIALGFVLRAIAGVVAIGAYLSPWLVVCTFLAALLLALGKRRHELHTRSDPAATRSSLGEYTAETLDQLLVVTIATLLMSYSLYTFFRADSLMMVTLPFAFFGVFRYHHLVHTDDIGASPEYLALDRPFVLNFLAWTTVAIGVLYDVHELIAITLL